MFYISSMWNLNKHKWQCSPQVLTFWIFPTRALSCLSLHWRSCFCSQLSSSPVTQQLPVQVNKPAGATEKIPHGVSENTHSLLLFFSLLLALQLFSMSTHSLLRQVQSKENIHTRMLVNSGETRRLCLRLKEIQSLRYGMIETSFIFSSTASSEDLSGSVLNFFHSMKSLRVTEAEYALLTATALLCSGQIFCFPRRGSLIRNNPINKSDQDVCMLYSTVSQQTYLELLWLKYAQRIISVSISRRPGVPAGSQLCWKNAGTDPGPAVQGVRGPGWSCTRRTAAVWPTAGQTDRAPNSPSQLPPPDETAAGTLTERTCW